MAFVLLAAFIGVPLLEIAVFIQVGGQIGLGATIAAVILTALAGTFLLRLQGFAVIQRARQSLERGEMPMSEVFDGICLVAAGALLLTPGFITDAVGFLLLLPPFRLWLKVVVLRRLVAKGQFTVHAQSSGANMNMHVDMQGTRPRTPPGPGPVIDGDFQVVDEDPTDADKKT